MLKIQKLIYLWFEVHSKQTGYLVELLLAFRDNCTGDVYWIFKQKPVCQILRDDVYCDVGTHHNQSRAENLFLCVSVQAQARKNAECHKESYFQWTYWKGLLAFFLKSY